VLKEINIIKRKRVSVREEMLEEENTKLKKEIIKLKEEISNIKEENIK
jgi:cell division protein FtsB